MCFCSAVSSPWFSDWGNGFRVQGLEFRVQGSWFLVLGSGLRVWGWVEGFGVEVLDLVKV